MLAAALSAALAVLPLATAQAAPTVLVWGDSLSAAYGIPLERGWVAGLQRRLKAEGYPHRVVNGSVSGETTAGGLGRLPAALARNEPAVLLIELGANDGLRGLSLATLRQNLEQMVSQAQAAGARVAVFEMMIPTNYGARYANGFRETFAEVAEASGARLVPFLLAPIALEMRWFQPDGIHPTAAAQPLILDAVWPHVEPLLRATSPEQNTEESE